MDANWNNQQIDDMTTEQRLRNSCRQIEQEAAWGRNLGYGNKSVRRGEYYTGHYRVSWLCRGRGPSAWAQVEVDKRTIGERIKMCPGVAVTLYLATAETIDAIEAGVYSP